MINVIIISAQTQVPKLLEAVLYLYENGSKSLWRDRNLCFISFGDVRKIVSWGGFQI